MVTHLRVQDVLRQVSHVSTPSLEEVMLVAGESCAGHQLCRLLSLRSLEYLNQKQTLLNRFTKKLLLSGEDNHPLGVTDSSRSVGA